MGTSEKQWVNTVEHVDMSIESGQSASEVHHTQGQPIGHLFPAVFDATTNHILYKVGNTSSDLQLLKYGGVPLAIAVGGASNTNLRETIDPAKYGGGYEYWQLITCSDAIGTVDAQSADRSITVNFAKLV